MTKRTAGLAAAVLCVAAVAASDQGQAQAQGWTPTRHVEMIVGADPGGNQDRTSRTVLGIVEKYKLVPTGISVVNKPGGAQVAALAYMNTKRGDPHYIMLLGSDWQNTAILNNDMSALNDMTPIIRMFESKTNYYVNATSPIKTARDAIDRLAKDPGALTISTSGARGGQNWVSIVQFGKAAGADPAKLRIAINSGGAEVITQVLGGHADIGVGGLDASLPLIESGKLRNIGLATAERMPGARTGELPTLREQGVRAASNNWSAIAGPKGMKPEEIAFWEGVFRTALATDEAKKFVEDSFRTFEIVGSKDFQGFLDANEKEQRAILSELGLITK